MGRHQLEVKKILVSTRVLPEIKAVLESFADNGERNVARVIERIITDCPRVKVALRKGNKK